MEELGGGVKSTGGVGVVRGGVRGGGVGRGESWEGGVRGDMQIPGVRQ